MTFNKKIRRDLQEFIGYLTEVEDALKSNIKGDSFYYTLVDHAKVESLRDSLIKQIKKQIL